MLVSASYSSMQHPQPKPTVAVQNNGLVDDLSFHIHALRVFLSMWVVLGHVFERGLVQFPWGGILAKSNHLAVILFFVLSGMVIQNSAQHHYATWQSYALARLTRVYSVALLAILITLSLDLWVMSQLSKDALATMPYPGWQYDNPMTHVALHLSFLGQSFRWTATPFSNVPYWSLTYEFWYYVLFGVLYYMRSAWRFVLVALLVLIMGEKLLLLLPAWGMGVALARLRVLPTLNVWISRLLLVMALAVGIAFFQTGQYDQLARTVHNAISGVPIQESSLGYSRWFAADLVIALIFCAVLCFLRDARLTIPGFLHRWITAFSGMSFSLYLIHDPIIKMVVAFGVRLNPWPVGLALILSLILVGAWTLAGLTERRLGFWRRVIGYSLITAGWFGRRWVQPLINLIGVTMRR